LKIKEVISAVFYGVIAKIQKRQYKEKRQRLKNTILVGGIPLVSEPKKEKLRSRNGTFLW